MFEARTEQRILIMGTGLMNGSMKRQSEPGESGPKGGTAYLLWYGTKLTAVESFGSRANGLESTPGEIYLKKEENN
jgi:hypothetical protein